MTSRYRPRSRLANWIYLLVWGLAFHSDAGGQNAEATHVGQTRTTIVTSDHPDFPFVWQVDDWGDVVAIQGAGRLSFSQDDQLNAGRSYYDGLGTGQNQAEGLKWLRRAADQGQFDAIKLLEKLDRRRAAWRLGGTCGRMKQIEPDLA